MSFLPIMQFSITTMQFSITTMLFAPSIYYTSLPIGYSAAMHTYVGAYLEVIDCIIKPLL